MKRLNAAGIRVSLFIDPAPEQVDGAVELESGHGGIAHRRAGQCVYGKGRAPGIGAAARGGDAGGRTSACRSTPATASITATLLSSTKSRIFVELNIGHSIIARALFVGIEAAVREMLGAMQNYPG